MNMMNKTLNNKDITFSIIVEKDTEGYFAECRDLQGCYAEGETYEEVLKNIKDVIELHVEDRVHRGDFKHTATDQVLLTTFSLPTPDFAA
jgi:predicted RNase H-like HicB family nuclease